MRVGLVSPYSYSYPGGVGQHVEALAEELMRLGHEVHVLAPYDPDDRLAWLSHRGVRPQARPVPGHVIPLGRTVAVNANGAVANLALSPEVCSTLYRRLSRANYDVVHVHEPNAPFASWCAAELARVPLVGTFHCYSTNGLVNRVAANVVGARRLFNKLHVRIAVSQAARWTAERFYGGHYRLIPNGVDLTAVPARHADGLAESSSESLRLTFVGRADERKGLPVLLRAFEGLRAAGVAVELVIVGATREEVAPYVLDTEGIEIAGRVTDAEKWRLLGEADLLCAPSLGGESFGMVLTEAFAAHTPVVASDIAGYRDVVRNGIDGTLVTPGDATELARAINDIAADPNRRAEMARSARERAERFAWPQVASEVVGAYEQACAVSEPEGRLARFGTQLGLRPADGHARTPPIKLPSPEPRIPGTRRRKLVRTGRRVGLVLAACLAFALTGVALERIGVSSILKSLLSAAPVWVVAAFGLMCLSMLMRAESWHAILRSALPGVSVKRGDARRGTMIGVLMSATLPARLGELSRAVVVARRLGHVRERLPVVAGTLISQTLLNMIALAVMGAVTFATVGLFAAHGLALLLVACVPLLLLVALIITPVLIGNSTVLRFGPLRASLITVRRVSTEVRSGLTALGDPRLGGWAAVAQLGAWAVQWLCCYLLLVALGLNKHAGLGAAAAVLFAVNVTAVVPATPSNVGIFQAACIAVLGAYGVGKTDAFAFGIILQAVEVVTAFALGMPAFVREGVSWKDLRTRAVHVAPVDVSALTRRPRPAKPPA